MKTKMNRWVACLPALIWVCGCGAKAPETTGAKAATEQPTKPAAEAPKSGHEDANGGHVHGLVRHPLGEQAAGGWKVSAEQADDVVPGGETVFYVTVTGDPKPGAIRLWVGDEQASHSTRAMAEAIDETRSHAHTEIPDPLAEGDQFWVGIDDGKGGTVNAGFKLAAGAVLPPQGPHTGFVAPLTGPSGAAGFAEIKLHDDKGDLELWLAKDKGVTEPLDLGLDTVVLAEFSEKGKTAELRVRNTEKNEDEGGKQNVRDGKTNYFIFPGATGTDSSWLKGDFRSPVKITIKTAEGALAAGPVTLIPHTHGPGGHHH